MNKIISILLLISVILISGCVSEKESVDPNNVIVKVEPIIIKEFQEQSVPIIIVNNATEPIDSVSVALFNPLTVVDSERVNIPAKNDKTEMISISVMVEAPGFMPETNISTLRLSYASGMDSKGNPVISTKSVPVQTTILPDAKLYDVGFVKNMEHLLDSKMETWKLHKGDNFTISFYVKNEGQTTIDEETLTVKYIVANDRIGGNGTFTIKQAMAKGGTSYTQGFEVPIKEDAPNGETDVYITLLKDENILDTYTLTLKVVL
jgi:PBP1b-binding outer membrane lipoprotein LpoB